MNIPLAKYHPSGKVRYLGSVSVTIVICSLLDTRVIFPRLSASNTLTIISRGKSAVRTILFLHILNLLRAYALCAGLIHDGVIKHRIYITINLHNIVNNKNKLFTKKNPLTRERIALFCRLNQPKCVSVLKIQMIFVYEPTSEFITKFPSLSENCYGT